MQLYTQKILKNEFPKTGGLSSKNVETLLLLGTSMGGARPKATIEDKEGLWLAKFNRFDDRWNCARIEHAMLTLAKICDINTAFSKIVKVGKSDVLFVKRFDRVKTKRGYYRSHMISALTVLNATETERDQWSYISLVERLRQFNQNPSKEAKELFKRMCFNALILNTDDHPRNHAFLKTGTHWQLSPAYDLTPSTPISFERRDLVMICGNQGRFANAKNLLSQSARFLLEKEEARNILDTMKEKIQYHCGMRLQNPAV